MKQIDGTPFRVVVADPLHKSGWELLAAAQDIVIQGPYDCREDLQDVLGEADALLICSDTNVDSDLIAAAPQLKAIARAGSRLDNVDIDEATRRGIFVIHVPDANVLAVVEYTFLLILIMARNFSPQAAGFDPRGVGLGFQLSGKTLGIVGFGRQGREIASRGQAFGMHVIAYDPYIDLSFGRERNVEIVDLPELLARADIVTLHTDYTDRTHHIMDERSFSQMKPGAYLVNCVHSALVDEDALMEALDRGKIAGAAIDTLDDQAREAPSPLTGHPKVWITPNLGQATTEAQGNAAASVVADLLAALRMEDFRNVVNLPFNPNLRYQDVKPYVALAVKLGKLQGQLAEGWITRVEVELRGEGLQKLVRPVAAVLLSGMIRPVDERPVNWVSAPVLAYEQGIVTSQAKDLVSTRDYPTLIACRIFWQGGQRTVAGALFGNGEVRLVAYDEFEVDAYPDGYVLVLENDDVPGVIGKVGTRLSQSEINIAQWRYGRDFIYGRGISFINVDQRVPAHVLTEIEAEPEIHQARLVRL
jgi:D-3-phosphoglycerate dehydrogenase